ncbi:MAG: putative membrane protein [Bermanella sp.]|jgi:putative membrane protein
MGLLKKILFLIFLIAILAYGALFAVQNDTPVPLDLLVMKLPELRLSLWLVAAFILGGLSGLLISALKLIQSKGQYQLVCRKLAKAEKELNQLRANSPKS